MQQKCINLQQNVEEQNRMITQIKQGLKGFVKAFSFDY